MAVAARQTWWPYAAILAVTGLGYLFGLSSYGGASPGNVNRVGEPVKSRESSANTHSGRSRNTLFDAGSTMSGP